MVKEQRFSLGASAMQHTAIARLDPRLRVGAALALCLATALLQSLWLLGAVLLGALVQAVVARLSLRESARKILAMDLFMLYLMLLLPFTVPGDSFATVWGYPASWQGLEQGARIALKANTVVILMLTLVSSLPPSALAAALQALKVPSSLVQLILFTLRFIHTIYDEYTRLRRSMKARGFVMGFNRHSWQSMGNLIAMLLLRSLERSERVLAAMKCRGYSGQLHAHYPMAWQRFDTYYALAVAVLVASLACATVFY
ncbi:MAG: cobalt ECF transporter T component CbiQ [Pseudomonadales bacterium]